MSPGRAARAMPAVVGDRLRSGWRLISSNHRAALQLGVERRAQRLDARDQHAAHAGSAASSRLNAVAIEIAHGQAERRRPARSAADPRRVRPGAAASAALCGGRSASFTVTRLLAAVADEPHARRRARRAARDLPDQLVVARDLAIVERRRSRRTARSPARSAGDPSLDVLDERPGARPARFSDRCRSASTSRSVTPM